MDVRGVMLQPLIWRSPRANAEACHQPWWEELWPGHSFLAVFNASWPISCQRPLPDLTITPFRPTWYKTCSASRFSSFLTTKSLIWSPKITLGC